MIGKKKVVKKSKTLSSRVKKNLKSKTKSIKKKKFYIFAYDPKIKKRVTYVVENGVATSLVSGHKFKYKG